jgi:hypothetical protein
MVSNFKKTKIKRALWIAACLVVLSFASGCGSNQNAAGTEVSQAYQQNGGSNGGTQNGESEGGHSGAEADGSTGLSEPDNAKADPADSGQSVQDSPAVENPGTADSADAGIKQGEGSYVGQVDTHSVEIETDNGAVVFQIDDKITEQLAGIAENAPISYEYIEKEVDAGSEKVKQLWLTKIEAK